MHFFVTTSSGVWGWTMSLLTIHMLFAQLDMPMWSIPLETYYAIWFIGGVILALAVIVRLVQSKK